MRCASQRRPPHIRFAGSREDPRSQARRRRGMPCCDPQTRTAAEPTRRQDLANDGIGGAVDMTRRRCGAVPVGHRADGSRWNDSGVMARQAHLDLATGRYAGRLPFDRGSVAESGAVELGPLRRQVEASLLPRSKGRALRYDLRHDRSKAARQDARRQIDCVITVPRWYRFGKSWSSRDSVFMDRCARGGSQVRG